MTTGNPDQPSVQKIKQTFKFAEERRTLWLNAHNKDDYGRHRGHVLYGFTCTPSGDSVIVAPGAAYTSFGTRLFYETADGVGNVVSAPAGWNTGLPKVLCVGLRLTNPAGFDARNVPAVDGDASNVYEFFFREVRYLRSEVTPARDLAPMDPINVGQNDAVPGTENEVSTADRPDTDPGVLPLAWHEIPICFFVVGVDPETGAVPTALTSPGVSKTECYNVFTMVQQVLGFDPLSGRSSTMVSRPDGATGTALAQDYAQRDYDGGAGIELLAPHYGTPAPNSALISTGAEKFKGDADKLSWSGLSWTQYRRPSFFRDGDPILWSLRRLDYVLRLWMNRTGDQFVVQATQDGSGTTGPHVREFMQLDAILASFPGDDSSGNLNTVSYALPGPGSNPSESNVLRSGRLPHQPPNLTPAALEATGLGDSHREALAALNISLRHLFRDLVGVVLDRQFLRNPTDWLPNPGVIGAALANELQWNDGPNGFLPDPAVIPGKPAPANRPVLTGAAQSAYLDYEHLRDAMQTALKRSHGTCNWVRDPGLQAGDVEGTGTDPVQPPAWQLNYPAAIEWQKSALQSNGMSYMSVNLGNAAGGRISQRIYVPSAQPLADVLLMHCAAALKVTAGSVVFGVAGYDVGDAEVFKATSVELGVDAEVHEHGFLFEVTGISAVAYLEVWVESTAPLSAVDVHGLSMGPGVPPISVVYDASFDNYLSRDGGEQSAMRGDTYLGRNEIYGANLKEDEFLVDGAFRGPKTTPAGAAVDPHLPDSAGIVRTLLEVLARENHGAASNLLLNPDFKARVAVDAGSPTITTVVVSSSTTWNIPANVNKINLVLVGGGGGGGGGRYPGTYGGGGGGGGGSGYLTAANNVLVTPGDSLNIVVGAGGTAGAAGVNGGDGGTTTVSGTFAGSPLTAAGGAGGIGATGQIGALGGSTSQPGGAGGSGGAAGATQAIAGTAANGGVAGAPGLHGNRDPAGAWQDKGGGGGGGGANGEGSIGGAGGDGNTDVNSPTSTPGGAGVFGGGGGGGGGGGNNPIDVGAAGGTGGGGYVIIRYANSALVTEPTSLTGAGIYTVPADVTSLSVTVIGGGGGGGGGGNGAHTSPDGGGGGGGGGGGDVVTSVLTVTPGDTFAYSCGLGGAGGAAGTPGSDNATDGGDGTTSTFGSLSAAGGAGGKRGRHPSGGGAGGDGGVGAGSGATGGAGGNGSGTAGAGQTGGSASPGVGGTGAPAGSPGAGSNAGGGGGGGGAAAAVGAVGGSGGRGASIWLGSGVAAAGGAGTFGAGGGGGGGGADDAENTPAAGGAGGSGAILVSATIASPTGYVFSSAPADWETTGAVTSEVLADGAVLLTVADSMYQTLLRGTRVDHVLRLMGSVSFATLVSNAGSSPATIGVYVYSGGVPVAGGTQVLQPGAGGPIGGTLQFSESDELPAGAELRFQLGAGIYVFAAPIWCNAGQPRLNSNDAARGDYLQRRGGPGSAMLGPLVGGGYRAVQFADAKYPQDLVTLAQLQAVEAALQAQIAAALS